MSGNDQWSIPTVHYWENPERENVPCFLLLLLVVQNLIAPSLFLDRARIEQIVLGHAQFEANQLSWDGKCCNASTLPPWRVR